MLVRVQYEVFLLTDDPDERLSLLRWTETPSSKSESQSACNFTASEFLLRYKQPSHWNRNQMGSSKLFWYLFQRKNCYEYFVSFNPALTYAMLCNDYCTHERINALEKKLEFYVHKVHHTMVYIDFFALPLNAIPLWWRSCRESLKTWQKVSLLGADWLVSIKTPESTKTFLSGLC